MVKRKLRAIELVIYLSVGVSYIYFISIRSWFLYYIQFGSRSSTVQCIYMSVLYSRDSYTYSLSVIVPYIQYMYCICQSYTVVIPVNSLSVVVFLYICQSYTLLVPIYTFCRSYTGSYIYVLSVSPHWS